MHAISYFIITVGSAKILYQPILSICMLSPLVSRGQHLHLPTINVSAGGVSETSQAIEAAANSTSGLIFNH
jgi:hypothetical protein